MSSTTTTRSLYTAKRLRSSGATRDQALDSLVGQGMNEAEAEAVVDDIDLKLGLDGRTLPDDASPAVRTQVTQHREVVRTAAPQEAHELAPRFETPPAPSASFASRPTSLPRAAAPARNVVPTMAQLAEGQATARPRFELAEPAEPAVDTDATPEKKELSASDRARLKAEATDRARVTQSPERLAAWLVREGMTQAEADTAARVAWDRAAARRQQAVSKQRGDQTIAWLEIIAGVVLLIGGLAAGWFVGLFLFIIIDGFRRLGS